MEKAKTHSKLKTRQKFSALDVRAEAAELDARLRGCKLANVYFAEPRSYILRFTRSGFKASLLLEAGTRFHCLDSFAEKNEKPNGFAMKLRKHLRQLFFDRAEQVGVERVLRLRLCGADEANLDFSFSLVLELYAKGNLVLLDGRGSVLALLRSHVYDAEHRCAVHAPYPWPQAAKYFFKDLQTGEEAAARLAAGEETTVGRVLAQMVPCAHQSLLDYVCGLQGLRQNARCSAQLTTRIAAAARAAADFYDPLRPLSGKGYLFHRAGEPDPFELAPFPLDWTAALGVPVTRQELPSFDLAAQAFYEQFHRQESLEAMNERVEREALRKFNKIKEDQDRRLEVIAQEIELCGRRAEAVELAAAEVSGICSIVRAMVEAGTGGLVRASLEQGRRAGDALASLIVDVSVERMTAVARLPDAAGEPVEVQLDLATDAGRNAGRFYEQRAKLLSKEQKTRSAAETALKSAKRSAQADIKRQQLENKKRIAQQSRKSLWFEKFYWFVSSENFLVITSRDAQQNEVLIKRYVEKNDVVFHAEVQGSAFTVVKNPQGLPLSPVLRAEAAQATLAHSRAWDMKVSVQVFAVQAHQVSKTAPTGLFLPMGSFMIYGKKTFVEAQKLEMSVGLLWRVDEESAAAHEGERRPRQIDEGAPAAVEEAEAKPALVEMLAERPRRDVKPPVPTPVAPKKSAAKARKGQPGRATKKQLEKLKKYAERYADEPAEERELRVWAQGLGQSEQLEKLAQQATFSVKRDPEGTAQPAVEPSSLPAAPAPALAPEPKPRPARAPRPAEPAEGEEEAEEGLEADNFRQLTGCPRPQDTLFEAYLVCAPYSTLQSYKYKVKLLPGTLKKGRAMKSAFELFAKQAESAPLERQLLQSIPEAVAVMQFLGNCKVQAPGLLKLVQQKKRKGKA